MNRGRNSLRGLLVVAAWLLAAPAPAGTPGSWSAHPGSVRVAGPDRFYAAPAAHPPPRARGHRIVRVRWHYRLPPGRETLVQLCTPTRCVPLTGSRGTDTALAGADAGVPLRLRFRLPPGCDRSLRVRAAVVLVDYR